MIIELKNNPWNTYEVLQTDGKYTELLCKCFIRNENLGDGILCTRQGQVIWIAFDPRLKFQPAAY